MQPKLLSNIHLNKQNKPNCKQTNKKTRKVDLALKGRLILLSFFYSLH